MTVTTPSVGAGDEPSRGVPDEEGFPPCGPDNEFDLYTDEFEVSYVCEEVEGLGWGWRQLGRS